MTKENKLALLVGFVVILVVGILLSDHFSLARHQKPADLLAVNDPLVESAAASAPLIDLAPNVPARTASNSPPTIGAGHPVEPGPIDHATTIRMPDLQRERPATVDPLVAAGPTIHQVRPGESLSSICMRHYGSETPVEQLALYNDLSDPDLVRVGHRLRLPPIEELTSGGRPVTPAGPASPAAKQITYVIRPGDCLSEIAQRLLGSAGRWPALYELNRQVISDPDDIPEGAVIKIPRGGLF